MRKLYFLIALTGCLFIAACEKDDESGDEANPSAVFDAKAITRGWVQSIYSSGKTQVYVPATYSGGSGYQFSSSGIVQSLVYESTANGPEGCGGNKPSTTSPENASVNTAHLSIKVLEEGTWSLDQVDQSWTLTLAFKNRTTKYQVPELNASRLKMELISNTVLTR
jgi:hypothetical protein